jgi:hypothetical protein
MHSCGQKDLHTIIVYGSNLNNAISYNVAEVLGERFIAESVYENAIINNN